MTREGRSVCIKHLFSIAMVTRNHQRHAYRRSRGGDCADGAIRRFAGAHRRRKITRMPHHIWVGDIGNN